MSQDTDTTTYEVVINDEEQYAVWPVGRDIPMGWRALPYRGTRDECLTWIKENWTDMRPASLRPASGSGATPP